MEGKYSMIVSTCANKEQARKIAGLLVNKRLAACVQMFPVNSVYTWQERICEEQEIMIFIKTRADLFDKVKREIKENHTYEVPEIIQISIEEGLPEYLKWMSDSTDGY